MEISPGELRDSEIREAFRGYHRDDVNDLLERAAETIDALSGRVRELGDRLAHVESGPQTPGRTRELEEMLERTLLLARRAAEEEVSEAQAKARQLVDDAEAKSRRLLADAEFDVRRRSEEERNRLASELVDLGQRREVLAAHVGDLDRFEAEYRERLIRSIEADLSVIGGRATAAPDVRPEAVDVEIPVLAEGVITRDVVDAPVPQQPEQPTQEISFAASAFDAEPASEPMPEPVAAVEDDDADMVAADLPPAPPAPYEPAPAPPAAPYGEATADHGAMAEAALDDADDGDLTDTGSPRELSLVEDRPSSMLDDDAFFAQLREAVSDERPLTDGEVTFFDQDHADTRTTRDLFGRRR